MATLRNKRKLAAINRNNYEDHHRNNQARNTNSPRVQEKFIIQVSEEIEGRLTKNGLRSSVGQKDAFWAPYHDQMNFF